MADYSYFGQGGKSYKRKYGGGVDEIKPVYGLPGGGTTAQLPSFVPPPAAPIVPPTAAYPEYTALPKPGLMPEPDIKTMRGQFAAGLQTDLAKALRQGQDIYAGRGITGSGEETRYFGQAQEGFGRALAGQEINLMELLRGVQGQNIQAQNVYGAGEAGRKSAYDIAKFGQRKTDLTNIVNTLKDQAAGAKPGDPIREQYNKAVSELLGLPYTPEAPGMQGTPGTSTIPGLPAPKPLEANNEVLGRMAGEFNKPVTGGAALVTQRRDFLWGTVKDLPEDSPARVMFTDFEKDVDKLDKLATIIDNPNIEPTQKEINDFMALITKVGNMPALDSLSARIGAEKEKTLEDARQLGIKARTPSWERRS